jgi:hypothetical protein
MEVELVINPLSRTAPTFKRPYMMSEEEVKGTEEAVNGITRGWVHSFGVFTLESTGFVCTEEIWIARDVCGLKVP